MGAGQGDRGPAVALADVQHEAAQPFPVHVPLAGHLLGGRQDGLDLAQVDQDRAGVLALLDHPGHDVALTPCVLTEGELVLGVAQPLQDDLPGGGGGDPAETSGRVVVLAQHLAVLAGLRGPDGHVPGAAIHLHPGGRGRVARLVVGDQQRVLDGLDRHGPSRCPSRSPGCAGRSGQCPSWPPRSPPGHDQARGPPRCPRRRPGRTRPAPARGRVRRSRVRPGHRRCPG